MPAKLSAATVSLLLILSLGPARAQTVEEAPPPEDGLNLMQEGAQLLFRGLMSEMEPALDEMGRALDEIEPALRKMGPALRDLVAMMGDIENYEAPVRMPNGDILIRRKPGAPPVPPEAAPEATPEAAPPRPGEIEL
jgi:hypothetical protein